MKILITGANGFIGKNLIARLRERQDAQVLVFTKESTREQLRQKVAQADFIFHLAGINRPTDPAEFVTGNVEL
ncbi:MAG TPA: NAD-dependent epimerase/dehydratase family protein, partial [Armatimonadota bacterium]|nr:NAD-dependent epimerase/dehydratase family protein [Armatimonadota bacterium]